MVETIHALTVRTGTWQDTTELVNRDWRERYRSRTQKLNLGPLGNTLAGAIGGAGGGSILSSLIPALAGGAGGLDIAAIAGQLVGGGATGAIVTAIVGAVMNVMKK